MNKQTLIENLIKLQRHLCIYVNMGSNLKNLKKTTRFCDCKFGCSDLMHVGGEQHGCPEARTVIDLLERMTDKEFEEIKNRDEDAYNEVRGMMKQRKDYKPLEKVYESKDGKGTIWK